MAETIQHTQLVYLAVCWIEQRLQHLQHICLLCDCPAVRSTEKPRPIEGHFPDVLVTTPHNAATVIGEAKTLPDLESQRSFKQISAFLRFLAFSPAPFFVIAVPFQATRTAHNIVRSAAETAGGSPVPFFVLTDPQVA